MAIDEAKLNAFMGKFVGDLGAVKHAATVVAGDRPVQGARGEAGDRGRALARRTAADPRYLREWLSAQAASGYAPYDAKTEAFSLTEEQEFALAIEGSGRVGSHPADAQARRYLDDRRAIRKRPLGGQRQSGEPVLLLSLNLHLHTGLAIAGSRPVLGGVGGCGSTGLRSS
jgi:hypothetical protein